ncbi:hypothetical protein [Eubacterium sp.]|jgi:hypothetical protein|uniref:hypothetical protein n=1 Tax=Eubacterium sp. TaxID=142586 RepID=UPI003A91FF6D
MSETKQDMSKTCGFSYQDNWTKANVTHEISHEEWKKWYATHCGKCQYMCEICMYGEE